MSLKFSITVLPMLERPIPVEADDSFVRIFFSQRNSECFFQHCPAMESLRRQAMFFSSNLATDDYELWDAWNRANMLSDPLASFSILGLSRLGLTLVDSHNFLGIFYTLVVMAAISYWLLVTYGPGPAGVALILLAVMDINLMSFNPNEFVLGLSLIVWAKMRRRGPASAWFLFCITFLMSGWHLIGKAWSVVSLIIYWWYARRPLTGAEKVWVTGVIIIILMSFCMPLLLVSGTGVLSIDGVWTHSPMELFSWHLPVITKILKDLIAFFKSTVFLLVLIIIGFFSLTVQERRENMFWIVLFSLLLTASLVDYLPLHPGHLLVRIWVPFIIFLTGLISHGLYCWANPVRLMIVEAWKTEYRTQDSYRNLFILTIILVFSLATIDQLVFSIISGLKLSERVVYRYTKRHDYDLSSAQPAKLLSGSVSCKDVLYGDMTLLFYYFSYGAYKCGALQYTANANNQKWISEQQDVTHLVTWNPINVNYGNLIMTKHTPIAIHLDDGLKDGVWSIGLHNPNRVPVRLQLFQRVERLDQEPQLLEKELPAGWLGWWRIGGSSTFAGQGFILAPVGSHTLHLTGMRIIQSGEQPGLRWPWDQGVMLSVADAKFKEGRRDIQFLSSQLLPNFNKKITIIDDTGSSLLAVLQ
ncbi:MAG: hypothetical protein HQL74_01520 [Magnetococcales bacterium]|nr:hypothetical protein [Magnetococcales bacterium]